MSRTKKFVSRDTNLYGKGMYATKDIKKGEVIHILDGKKMSIRDFIESVNSDKENIDDPLQVGLRTYINLDEISRTFNHSCNPNAGIRKRSELFAIKDIHEGDQITYDYSSTIAPTEWGMKCKCGERNCRGTLGDVLSVPEKQLTMYKEAGGLQRYMRLLLKKVKEGKYVIPKYEKFLLESLKKTSNL